MFDTDLDQICQGTFPRTAINFQSMNSNLLQPWSKHQILKKQPLMNYRDHFILKKYQPIKRAGTQELFRKRFKKNDTQQKKAYIPISTLTFYHAQKQKKQVKKKSHILKIKKTAKSEGKFQQKPRKQFILSQQLVSKQEISKGLKPSFDRMSHLKNKIQYQKNLQYVSNKKQCIFTRPIISEVLLTPKDYSKNQSFSEVLKQQQNVTQESHKSEYKKPKKALFVGLVKFRSTQKKQKVSPLKGHSFGL